MPKTSDEPSISFNRFQLLSEDEEAIPFKEKIPPIIVDSAHTSSTVIGLFGDKYTYKRTTTGMKISVRRYNDALKEHYMVYQHWMKN